MNCKQFRDIETGHKKDIQRAVNLFEKVEEGVDVEIDKAAISQSVMLVNPLIQDMHVLYKSRKILFG